MKRSYDAIIIGAGHNGLVAAAYLAKSGRKILVLERRAAIGGIATTEEIYPGFKYNSCAHVCNGFAPAVVRELDLRRHGYETINFEPLLFAPLSDANSLLFPRDPSKIVQEIGRFSRSDADKFEPFCRLVKKLTSYLQTLNDARFPDRASQTYFTLSELVKLAWKFRRLGKKDMHEFLRIIPRSISDFLNEWFDTDLLKAALAASGIRAMPVGPRAQGTSLVFLYHRLGESNGALRTSGFVRGGMGNLPQAIARAAQQHGAEIQIDTEAARILTRNGSATGVMLQSGEEIAATAVISSADVKRTFLKLVEPTYLDPHFLLQVRNIKARGTMGKINLALDRLPRFRSINGSGSANPAGGMIHIGPSLDYLERAADDAKYGAFSQEPVLEITIPSVLDSSLAPPGKHVMSVWMQYAPYRLKDGDWSVEREALGDLVMNVVEEYAPGVKDAILHRQVLTPLDLEENYGVTGGHIYHGEMTLDQLFFMRPIPGWARYRTPVENLYLCGSGTHPAGDISGLPGYYAAREVLHDLQQKR